MKTFLILILSFTLVGGAWLSKPSERSFAEMVKRKVAAQSGENKTVLDVILGKKNKTERFLSECHFKDRVLWVTVERDGKTIYTGAFNTWFPSDLKIEKAEG